MKLGVQSSSLFVEGRLGSPCHPDRGISLGQRLKYPGLTKKKPPMSPSPLPNQSTEVS